MTPLRPPYLFLLATFFLGAGLVHGQGPYGPPPGEAGTTAIHKDSSVFTGWAVGCSVTRGPQDITDTSEGYASSGEAPNAEGKARANGVVSLGDGGTATLTFDGGIRNGPGPDLAVFENSFNDHFLELAFVEVSSNGEDFFRFEAVSLTDTSNQVGTFDSLDATNLYNLAGKYRAEYGTPFDLEELEGKPGLDIDHITHLRVVDVIGNINDPYATRDSRGNKVNDPWPTVFSSGGFDLDAVGVIHSGASSGKEEHRSKALRVHPNPVQRGEPFILQCGKIGESVLRIYDISGTSIRSVHLEKGDARKRIGTERLSRGVYFLELAAGNRTRNAKLIVE